MLEKELVTTALDTLAVLFIFVVGVIALAVIITFLIDVFQTRHAIRRNHPVIGRFRYLFEHVGTFFRQYFFAADREELPLTAPSAPGFIGRQKILKHRGLWLNQGFKTGRHNLFCKLPIPETGRCGLRSSTRRYW